MGTVTVALPTLTNVQMQRLETWLQQVLWEAILPSNSVQNTFAVHRLKGRVILGDGSIYMIQGVREVFEISKQSNKPKVGRTQDEVAPGKLVIIGMSVSELAWQQSLEQAIREK